MTVMQRYWKKLLWTVQTTFFPLRTFCILTLFFILVNQISHLQVCDESKLLPAHNVLLKIIPPLFTYFLCVYPFSFFSIFADNYVTVKYKTRRGEANCAFKIHFWIVRSRVFWHTILHIGKPHEHTKATSHLFRHHNILYLNSPSCKLHRMSLRPVGT